MRTRVLLSCLVAITVTVAARGLKAAAKGVDSHALLPSGGDGRSSGNAGPVDEAKNAEQDGSVVHYHGGMPSSSSDETQGAQAGDGSAAEGAGGQAPVAGADGEPIDFRKMGNILKNAPVLTEAAKHLGAMTWKNKVNEEEISRNAADIPVANVLPLAYHGKPNPDDLGFMPPTVDQSLGLTGGPLENSDEVRLGAEPIKAAKPLSRQ